MAQARQYPVKRPAGFHWDFFLLGCTTFVSGILGLPAPNGLVPQAPVHTESLCVTKMVPEDTKLHENGFLDEKTALLERERSRDEHEHQTMKVVRTRLVEQRVSHLVMGVSSQETAMRVWELTSFALISFSSWAVCPDHCSSCCEFAYYLWKLGNGGADNGLS